MSFSPEDTLGNQEFLVKMARTRMPFGKYKNRYLLDLPEAYVAWFQKKGYPNGELGLMLQAMYEVKINGLEPLIRPLIIKNEMP